MVRLIWTDEALDGLNQIAEYIAVSNPQAAKKLVQTVFEKVSRVERFLSLDGYPRSCLATHSYAWSGSLGPDVGHMPWHLHLP